MQEQLLNVKSYNKNIFEKLYKVDRQLTELKNKTDTLITESKNRVKALVKVSIKTISYHIIHIQGNKRASGAISTAKNVCY